MMASPVRPRRVRGFTLLELVIAAIIVAVLAAISMSSYRSYVLRTNRALVRAALVDMAAKLEVEALNTGRYPATFDFYLRGDAGDTALLGEVEIGIDRRGQFTAEGTAADNPNSLYSIRLRLDADDDGDGLPEGTSFELVATAQNGQAADSRCRELRLGSTGLRSAPPDNDPDCWAQ